MKANGGLCRAREASRLAYGTNVIAAAEFEKSYFRRNSKKLTLTTAAETIPSAERNYDLLNQTSSYY